MATATAMTAPGKTLKTTAATAITAVGENLTTAPTMPTNHVMEDNSTDTKKKPQNNVSSK